MALIGGHCNLGMEASPQIWGAVELSNRVLREGYPNIYGAKIPIPTHLNLDRFQELLHGYHDMEVIEFLRYGWPSNRVPGAPAPTVNNMNHNSAVNHPGFIDQYVHKESSHGAVIGLFVDIPFKGHVGVSPLSTRPKHKAGEWRAILDLSYPKGSLVNDFTPKDSYLGLPFTLVFLSVDDLAKRMHELG